MVLAFYRSHRRGLCGVLALAAALLATAPARAQPPTSLETQPEIAQAEPPVAVPAKPKIEPGQVIRRPTEEETSDLYPAEARKHAKQGEAAVTCEIGLSTRLEHCVVTSEDPPGFGFGDALMRATVFYRVRPPTVDGKPVAHVKIRIPMRFQFNLDKAVAQMPAPTLAEKPPPRETDAERLKRLGPLKRSDDVLWAPLALAGYALAGLVWALFWPIRERRRKPRRIPGHLA